MSIVARLLVRAAAAILPRPIRHWGDVMRYEVASIDSARDAIPFALGCLGGALREAAAYHFLRPLEPIGADIMPSGNQLHRPRLLTGLCAIGATGLGLAYMGLAGAPVRYLAMNIGAVLLGFLFAGGILWSARSSRLAPGTAVLAMGLALLLTTVFGTSANGATRWMPLGGIAVQPSLILLPPMIVVFARSRDALSLVGMLLAAVALAMQPDRAMAGTLAAGLAVLALIRAERNVMIALLSGMGAFAATLMQPDIQPAMPYVDHILYSSFDVHLLAGLAVISGAALMLVPAIAGYAQDRDRREVHAVFGAAWLAIIAAAALGNYPTPLVGYGGSAIVGYLLCMAALPARTASIGVGDQASRGDARNGPELSRVAQPF